MAEIIKHGALHADDWEVLRLAEQAYIRTGAWNSLLDIIPSMAKANVSDEEHRAELEQLAWIGLMDKALADGGSEADWCGKPAVDAVYQPDARRSEDLRKRYQTFRSLYQNDLAFRNQ